MNTCHSGFDCKSMTGETGQDCPNLHVCNSSFRRHLPSDYYISREPISYYIDLRNNALTVNHFLSPTAREAGWHVALILPYKYENNCLIVDGNKYYYESTELARSELTQIGWLPFQSLPSAICQWRVHGY